METQEVGYGKHDPGAIVLRFVVLFPLTLLLFPLVCPSAGVILSDSEESRPDIVTVSQCLLVRITFSEKKIQLLYLKPVLALHPTPHLQNGLLDEKVVRKKSHF
jgi:hypothetical protein